MNDFKRDKLMKRWNISFNSFKEVFNSSCLKHK